MIVVVDVLATIAPALTSKGELFSEMIAARKPSGPSTTLEMHMPLPVLKESKLNMRGRGSVQFGMSARIFRYHLALACSRDDEQLGFHLISFEFCHLSTHLFFWIKSLSFAVELMEYCATMMSRSTHSHLNNRTRKWIFYFKAFPYKFGTMAHSRTWFCSTHVNKE